MKRLLVLLVLLAGGLVAAALAVPSNAAVVNGAAISQQQLNSDVSAIASSPEYQCYLNSEEYLSSEGTSELPPVTGAGTGQSIGDHPTATTAFVATYLDTEIGHEVVEQLAAERGVTVGPAQLDAARSTYEGEITEVMAEVAQTAEGENAAFTCGDVSRPLTGSEILSTLPSSFVDNQVQFVATATALQEDLSGVGASAADLQRYFASHSAEFDTACFTVAVYTSESAAEEAASAVALGTSTFSSLAASSEGGGQQGCEVLYEVAEQLPTAHLDTLPLNTVSAPISSNGTYFLIEITKRSPTPYSQVEQLVSQAVQQSGSTRTQKVIDAAERHSDVSVNPRYGVWVPTPGAVLVPASPRPADVLNPSANEPASSSTSSSPVSG